MFSAQVDKPGGNQDNSVKQEPDRRNWLTVSLGTVLVVVAGSSAIIREYQLKDPLEKFDALKKLSPEAGPKQFLDATNNLYQSLKSSHVSLISVTDAKRYEEILSKHLLAWIKQVVSTDRDLFSAQLETGQKRAFPTPLTPLQSKRIEWYTPTEERNNLRLALMLLPENERETSAIRILNDLSKKIGDSDSSTTPLAQAKQLFCLCSCFESLDLKREDVEKDLKFNSSPHLKNWSIARSTDQVSHFEKSDELKTQSIKIATELLEQVFEDTAKYSTNPDEELSLPMVKDVLDSLSVALRLAEAHRVPVSRLNLHYSKEVLKQILTPCLQIALKEPIDYSETQKYLSQIERIPPAFGFDVFEVLDLEETKTAITLAIADSQKRSDGYQQQSLSGLKGRTSAESKRDKLRHKKEMLETLLKFLKGEDIIFDRRSGSNSAPYESAQSGIQLQSGSQLGSSGSSHVSP